ncbi:MAG: intermembrane phospholipid transport protein YdbH family protein, partial [Tepidisphaeraceae bacterium]
EATATQNEGLLALRAEVLAGEGRLSVIGTGFARSGNGDVQVVAEQIDAGALSALAAAMASHIEYRATGQIDGAARILLRDWSARIDGRFELREVRVDAGSLGPNVQGLSGVFTFGGVIAADAPISADMNMEAVKFASPEIGLECAGMSGAVALDDARSPGAQTTQHLRIQSLKVGETELTDGAIGFRLDGWKSIIVDQTSWHWLGGTVSSRGVRIGVPWRRIELSLGLQRVDLEKFLALVARGKATGEGKVSGIVPVTIEKLASGNKVTFGSGVLAAEPGGRLAVTDLPAFAAAMRESPSDPGKIKQHILDAISDFEFDTLRTELHQEPQGLTAMTRISGRGRSGARQALDLDLRVRGLDVLLNSYLGLREKFASPTTRGTAN